MLDGWKDIEGIIKAFSTFLKSSESSWLATIALRKFENSLPRNTIRPAVATDNYPVWKRLGWNCLCLPIRKTRVTTWVRVPMSTHWKGTSYDSIFLIVGLHDEQVQISWCTQTVRNNFSHCNSMPQFLKISNKDSVFASKFWSFLYHYWAWLRSSSMRLLRKHWIEISWLNGLDIANLFPPNLLGYMHGFSY